MSSRKFRSLTRGLSALAAAAWPQACALCGGVCGDSLCGVCAASLPRPGASCPRCALPTPDGVPCGRCLRRAPHYDSTRAAFLYEFPLREMLLQYKHGQRFGLRRLFAQALCEQAADIEVDCVVPMPLHQARLGERGFNQSVEIARELARRYRCPLWPQAVRRDTPHGREARALERRRRVRGAFRCTRDFVGLRVLVVDDVMTSGATLDELARALKQRGASAVHNLVVARTPRVLR